MADGRTLTLKVPADGDDIVLGRGCPALPQLSAGNVATQHARLFRRNGSWCVQDLGTQQGTLLNGVEVFGAKQVNDGDVLAIAGTDVVLTLSAAAHSARDSEGVAVHRVENPGEVTLAIRGLKIAVPGRMILEDITTVARAGEFIGILGPSGCGKTTLIKAIAGLISCDETAIRIASDGPADALQATAVAYLPQEVVIHDQLVVEEALSYISAFKAVGSQLAPDRDAVRSVGEQVALSDRMRTRIASLSGGQKKRVGLAAELLGNPRIILLDEATSGLDPATEADQMDLFRDLAESGKTVLCVTHNPSRLNRCHRVLFLAAGRLLFDGSPQGLVDAMRARTLDEVYRKAQRTPVEQLVAELSAARATEQSVAESRMVGAPATHGLPSRRFSWLLLRMQSELLVRRYAQLVLADWRNLALLIGQAPAIAILVVLTFGNVKANFAELHAARLKEVFLIQTLAVLWCSGTASIREIVKEWPLLRHEQRYGIMPSGVVLSKFVLLGVMAVVQAFLLTAITKIGCSVTGSWVTQLGVLSALGCVGVLQGLCISAVAGTTERAMTILPVLLIGEAIISGGFAQLDGVMRLLAQLLNPAYWALDGLRTTLGTELLIATFPGAPGTFQPPILGLSGPIYLDFAVLAVQGAALFVLTHMFLCAGLATRWSTGLRGTLADVALAARRLFND